MAIVAGDGCSAIGIRTIAQSTDDVEIPLREVKC